jgi:hypothetical protein
MHRDDWCGLKPQTWGEYRMPLKRSKEQLLLSMNGVTFLMADGDTEVPCRVSQELLCDKFGSKGDRAGDETAFRLNRESIERAASDKYDTGELAPHSDARVIVIAADMASSLSKKMQ